MENLQAPLDFVLSHVPSQWLNTITTHSTTYWTIYKTLLSFRNIFVSLFTPLLQRLQTSPDVASFLLLALLLWVSYQFLTMARRALVFWIKTTMQVTWWGGLAAIGMWLWSRGADGAWEDVSKVVAFFQQELSRYKEQEAGGGRVAGGRTGQGAGTGRAGWR